MSTRPGTGLRRIAVRLLPPATVERFVDPAVADLQHEYIAAHARTRWRAQAIRLAGTLRLVEVIALISGRYALARGWARFSRPSPSTVFTTERAMTAVGGLTSTITVSMVIAISMMAVRYSAYPGAELQISAFSLLAAFEAGGLQFGFTLALLTTIGRTPAMRLKQAALLAMSVLFSGVSVYIISVTLPSPQVLSPTALVDHAFIRPDDARSMLFAYGTRIAAGVSPLLFCVFALTLARRVRIAVAFPAAISVWAAYLVWFTWLRQPLIASSIPIRLAVWAPDVAIVLSTLLLAYAYTDRNLRETFTR